ncbi:MAG: hypothetical protein ACJ8NS_13640 [Chthoniobacterales bacterium]
MIIPFTVTPEVETYLAQTLSHPPVGDFEAALVWTTRYIIDDHDVGPALTIGYYPIGTRSPDSFFSLAGHSVSIVRATLDKLAGKELVFEHRIVGVEGSKHSVKVLSAK